MEASSERVDEKRLAHPRTSAIRDSPDRDLSLPEMLRIMDVAREMRLAREAAEVQLDLDDAKAALRARLRAAADASGDPVTDEEIEAAIAQYFDTQHVYSDPPLSVRSFLAHLYVRRTGIAVLLAGFTLAAAIGWALLLRPNAPYSSAGRRSRAATAAVEPVAREVRSVLAIAREPEAKAEAERVLQEAEDLASAGKLDELNRLRDSMLRLQRRLEEEYEVRIVTGPGRKSGIDRYQPTDGRTDKKISGYYVLVEARSAKGTVVSRSIRNREENRDETVDAWGELVPQAVYERVKKDKADDGVVDETLFAVKRRGFRNEEVVFAGEDGKPLVRRGQITRW